MRCVLVLSRGRLFFNRNTEMVGVEKDNPVLKDESGIGLGTMSASGIVSRMRRDGEVGEGISYILEDHCSGVLEGETERDGETGDKEDKEVGELVVSTIESVFERANNAERRVSILLGESSRCRFPECNSALSWGGIFVFEAFRIF